MDAYERNGDPRFLDMAASAAEYILKELYWTDGDSVASFSYPLPSLRSQVHNANFLGSALLCRIYKECGEKKFLEPALKVARYSAAKQREDGSWDYGSCPHKAGSTIFTRVTTCVPCGRLLNMPRHRNLNPISIGDSISTEHIFSGKMAHPGISTPHLSHRHTQCGAEHHHAVGLKDLDWDNTRKLAHSVWKWAMIHMWDEQGYFYHQAFPFFTSKVPYMRCWSQAWMLLALSDPLETRV